MELFIIDAIACLIAVLGISVGWTAKATLIERTTERRNHHA